MPVLLAQVPQLLLSPNSSSGGGGGGFRVEDVRGFWDLGFRATLGFRIRGLGILNIGFMF